ncbi:atp-dependent RNA helicase ddx18 [Anaeramoeba flamelloides]|uniref:Atp-dependent RNA helicase ddx18 n=1 Tax=Anaeramoeba flamelloides TaxID=1746091 RepID=A0ABQ8YU73_9EUKA|nr:atp-dependent RNA helicase ddx18 [Anaeramoeba flamelloides]
MSNSRKNNSKRKNKNKEQQINKINNNQKKEEQTKSKQSQNLKTIIIKPKCKWLKISLRLKTKKPKERKGHQKKKNSKQCSSLLTQTRRIRTCKSCRLKRKAPYTSVYEQSKVRQQLKPWSRGTCDLPAGQRNFDSIHILKGGIITSKSLSFFSSVNSVKYHHELLKYLDVDAMFLHRASKRSEQIQH